MFKALKALFAVKGNSGMLDSCKLNGIIHLELRDKNGHLREDRLIKNTITAAGRTQLARLMTLDVAGTAFDYVAIGIGTPGATTLGSEMASVGGERRGGANTVGTVVSIGTGTNNGAQFVTTFTFTGTGAITEEGIFNAASGGTMLASQSFAALNVVSGDTLAITHQIQVS